MRIKGLGILFGENLVARIALLEPLWPQERVEQISSQQDGEYATEQIFEIHPVLLQTITRADIRPRERKEADGHRNQDEIFHAHSSYR